jgi:hypothetical protein
MRYKSFGLSLMLSINMMALSQEARIGYPRPRGKAPESWLPSLRRVRGLGAIQPKDSDGSACR